MWGPASAGLEEIRLKADATIDSFTSDLCQRRPRPHLDENMGILGEVSASVRGRGGAPPPVEKRLRPHLGEDMGILGEVSASVRAGGGAPAPVEKR